MKTIIYQDDSGFDILAQEWDDLLGRSFKAPIFMRYSYQRSWWQCLGNGDLVLITFRDDDDRLTGLAPLYGTIDQSGQRQLNFVGCVEVSDYLDLLVDQNHLQSVHQALLDCLSSDELEWDRLFLCSLPHYSPTHTQLAQAAQARGWQVRVTQQDVCPVITLPDSWEDYLAGLKKKQRHEIRRKIRKIETEAETRWRVVDSTEGLDEAMDVFIRLHQQSTGDKQEFWDERMTLFFRQVTAELAKAGWVKLFFIEVNGHQAATLLCFDYENEFLVYNSGYDPEQFAHLSPGNVLVAYSIQEAIRLGRRRYDFLRGDEVYKFRFGAVAEPVYDLEISRQ